MPDDHTWPPPPDTPSPLMKHDTFLTALVRAPVTKSPLSRLRLMRRRALEHG